MLFTIDDLMAEASRETGLDEFGEGHFRDNAQLLIADAFASRPTAAGLETLRKRVSRLLQTRLRLTADRKAYREIAAQEVRAPIVVLGLPRSGTTFIHALLAQNPALRSPLQWEVVRPSPPPRAETYRTDPRIALARREMDGDREMLKLHIQDAELPVECGPVAAHEFMNTGNYAFWDAPNYLARVIGRDGPEYGLSAYRRHREMLQHLQAFTPHERWVLKSPQHIGNLDALLQVYPDAVLVFTHRDPGQTVPSLASLVSHLRGRNYDFVDKLALGPSLLDLWSQLTDRCMVYLDAHPGIAARCLHVPYKRLIQDPLGVAREVHARAGLSVSDAAEAVMNAWADQNRQDRWRSKHGEHRYAAKDFGLEAGEIADRFAEYRARFVEPAEGGLGARPHVPSQQQEVG